MASAAAEQSKSEPDLRGGGGEKDGAADAADNTSTAVVAALSQQGLSSLTKFVRAVTLPLRVPGSAIKVQLRRALGPAKRKTWNVAIETSITCLRSAAKNVPRNISAMRMVADQTVPGLLCPSGVLRVEDCIKGHDGADLVTEWIWPNRLTPNLQPSKFSASGELSKATAQSYKQDLGWQAALEERPVVLFLHGGAYCLCNRGSHRELVFRLALDTNAVFLVLDYRRPPTHQMPVAVHDALAAYKYLTVDLNVAPKQVVFMGDSAGGGLCVTAMLELRTRAAAAPAAPLYPPPLYQPHDGVPGELEAAPVAELPDLTQPRDESAALELPAGAVLLSPWVDMTDTRPSQTKHEQYDYLPHDLVELFAAASCEGEAATSQGLGFARAFSKSGSATALADADGNNGGGSSPAPSSSGPVAVDRADPSVSPIYGDLSRLPPMLIHVGQCEVLRDQIVEFAQRARSAGVDIELQEWRDMVHIFHLFSFCHPTPRAATQQVGAFVRGCAGAAYPWFVAMVEVHKGEGLLETESILKQSTYVEMHAVDLTQLGSGAISGRLVIQKLDDPPEDDSSSSSMDQYWRGVGGVNGVHGSLSTSGRTDVCPNGGSSPEWALPLSGLVQVDLSGLKDPALTMVVWSNNPTATLGLKSMEVGRATIRVKRSMKGSVSQVVALDSGGSLHCTFHISRSNAESVVPAGMTVSSALAFSSCNQWDTEAPARELPGRLLDFSRLHQTPDCVPLPLQPQSEDSPHNPTQPFHLLR